MVFEINENINGIQFPTLVTNIPSFSLLSVSKFLIAYKIVIKTKKNVHLNSTL